MPEPSLHSNDPSSTDQHPLPSGSSQTAGTLPTGSYQSSSSESGLPLLDLSDPVRRAHLKAWENFPTDEKDQWEVVRKELGLAPGFGNDAKFGQRIADSAPERPRGSFDETPTDISAHTAETGRVSTQPSTQQRDSLMTDYEVAEASTQGGQPSGEKRKGHSGWISGFSDDFVWKWGVTPRRERGKAIYPTDKTANYQKELFRGYVRSLDFNTRGSVWREGDLSTLVDNVVKIEQAKRIASAQSVEELTGEAAKMVFLGDMARKVYEKLNWHLLRMASQQDAEGESQQWLRDVSKEILKLARQERHPNCRLTSIGKFDKESIPKGKRDHF